MDVLCSVLNAVASWISPYYRGFTALSKLTLIVILYLLALFLLNFKFTSVTYRPYNEITYNLPD